MSRMSEFLYKKRPGRRLSSSMSHNCFFALALATALALVFLNAMITDVLMIPDFLTFTQSFVMATPGLGLLAAAWVVAAMRPAPLCPPEQSRQARPDPGDVKSRDREEMVED